MVQRYRNQINEAATPAAFGHNYVDGAATGVQVAGAIVGAGEEIRRFAEIRKRQQDEWDAATVINAQTEYARQMSDGGRVLAEARRESSALVALRGRRGDRAVPHLKPRPGRGERLGAAAV